MRPYLAVIQDSFVEALRSRVLWVLIAGWTIVLAAVAPFSILQGTTFDIQPDQILARNQLTEALTAASEGNGTPSQQAVWNAMDADLRQQIIDRKKNSRGGRLPMGELARGLSSVLSDSKLYSETAWPKATRRNELKELIDTGTDKLSKTDLEKLNRKLIELAFPGIIRSGEGNAVWIGYAGQKVGEVLPLSRKQIEPFLEGVILLTIMRVGLGIVGIFAGVIVTSNMIPDMFQTGSLHLLLSKPISRSGLLIAKFIGGTAFVALNVSYLLIGFFFLVGIRLELWNYGILMCIPVFIFIFMIFYSVSTLAGLIWKNAIISIAITALFWGFCTTVGITHGVMEGIVTRWPRITNLIRVKDEIISVNGRGRMSFWDESKSTWQNAYGESNLDETIIGPYWIESQNALFFGRPYRIPFGGIQSDGIRLQYAKLPELSGTNSVESKLDPESTTTNRVTQPTPLWSDKRIDSAPELPTRTRRVTGYRDTFLSLTERGLYRFKPGSVEDQNSRNPISIFGFQLPTPKSAESEPFELLTPTDWQPAPPLSLSASELTDWIVVYSHGSIIPLQKQDDAELFVPLESVDMQLPDGTLALLASNAKQCVIATNKQGAFSVPIGEWKNFTPIKGLEKIIPRAIYVSTFDQSFVIVDRSDSVWTIDQNATRVTKANIPHQGDISAIHLDRDGRWWLAHNTNQVTLYDPAKSKVVSTLKPTWSWVDTIYYRLVEPLYLVNPKPAAVNEVIAACLTDKDPLSLGRETSELEDISSGDKNFWQPLWSNAMFIIFMLTIGCAYLYRQDL